MKKGKNIFEINLNSKNVTKESWLKFIKVISKYIGYFRRWEIVILHENSDIKYYIVSNCNIPSTMCGLDDFLIKKVENDLSIFSNSSLSYYMNDISNNFADIIDKEEVKRNKSVKRLEIKIRALNEEKILSKSFIYFEKHNQFFKKRILITIPQNLLSIDFIKNSKYFYKKTTNYLDIQKTQHMLCTNPQNALFKVNVFPYLQGNYYLNQNNYDFDKHSLIVGSSGSGKSKLISLFVNNLYKNEELKRKYKVVIIDPHSALEKDIGGLENSKVINFEKQNSINLFESDSKNIISSTEMIMSILKSLISDNYNPKLERVLRYSVHLLVMCRKFNFKNLRKLLLNSEYRNIYIKELQGIIPISISEFFLTEFSELKSKYYNEAISPIISFIDEMELLPAFEDREDNKDTLNSTLESNFLTLFSLNRVSIGDKGVKTISSLIMEQLMQIIQSRENNEHIILIVDEVSVIENPILMNFLSEARKYNLSIILSQQYFSQISEPLQSAIFANVINYYIFRVSKNDASILTNNISIKIPNKDTNKEKIDMLVNLNNRECIVRVSNDGVILPVFKGETVDFIPNPLKEIIYVDSEKISIDYEEDKPVTQFEVGNEVNLFDLLLNQSSGRKDIKEIV